MLDAGLDDVVVGEGELLGSERARVEALPSDAEPYAEPSTMVKSSLMRFSNSKSLLEVTFS